MIRKIQNSEYLKRVDNMTVVERTEYQERVGRWLAAGAKVIASRVGEDQNARLQNVLTISGGWNDAECAAFEEGASLLTALVGRSDTWLPEMLYAKAAGRCVRQMIKCLAHIPSQEGQRAVTPADNGLTKDSGRMQAGAAKEAVMTEAPQKEQKEQKEAGNTEGAPGKRGPGRPRKNASPAGEPQEAVENGKQEGDGKQEGNGKQGTAVAGVPVRPKHIDQYVHLLPKKTQERAEEVRVLLRDLDVARENMRKLMEAGERAEKAAQWAKAATRIDERVKGIYRELDEEWEKLVKSGRVVVDIFGNASLNTEATEGTESTEPSSEEKAKRRNMRKWLTDTRYGNDTEQGKNEHARKWRERFKEYLAIEGDTAYEDKKLIEAANHYGIDIEAMKDDKKTADASSTKDASTTD